MSPQRSLPHLPALDGLRGLALLAVLLFHSKKALVGGYLGVDLFFVISGYLITSLLLAEQRSRGVIDLSAFWRRRARRLLPALLVLMPAIALYCRFLAQPDELARIRGDALATLGYVANWRAIFSHRTYWELFAAPSPLEHMWSLAIEEQFYIVWPVVLRVVLRKQDTSASSRTVLRLAFALLVISCGLALVLLTLHPQRTSRVYFGTDTRIVAILAGAVLAAVLPPTTTFTAAHARKLDAFGLLAAITLGVAWWKLDGESPLLYRGGFWLTELAAVVLIACAVVGPSRSVVARVLAWRPFVLVGIISYGLYLWHWPVNVVVTPERFEMLGAGGCRLVQTVVTFAIAIASYVVLERPIRTRGLPFGRPMVVVPAALVIAALLIVTSTRDTAHAAAHTDSHATPPSTIPASTASAATAAPTFKIAIFGDSTAGSLGWTLRGVRRPNVSVALLGKDGCTMLYDGCDGEHWTERLKELEPNATLLFVGGAFMHEMELSDGGSLTACHPTWNATFEGMLSKRLAELVAFVPKTRVFALTTPLAVGSTWGGPELRDQVTCINKSIRLAASAVPGVELLDLSERVCPRGTCILHEPGMTIPIRPDGVHFHMEGANAVSAWVLDQISRAPRTAPSLTER